MGQGGRCGCGLPALPGGPIGGEALCARCALELPKGHAPWRTQARALVGAEQRLGAGSVRSIIVAHLWLQGSVVAGLVFSRLEERSGAAFAGLKAPPDDGITLEAACASFPSVPDAWLKPSVGFQTLPRSDDPEDSRWRSEVLAAIERIERGEPVGLPRLRELRATAPFPWAPAEYLPGPSGLIRKALSIDPAIPLRPRGWALMGIALGAQPVCQDAQEFSEGRVPAWRSALNRSREDPTRVEVQESGLS